MKPAIALVWLWCFVSAAALAEEQHRDTCATACIEIFGGAMPIPAGYKVQPDFTDPLRLIRLDRDPRKGSGHIDIGKIESLEPRAEREKSAHDLGASFERQSRGGLSIEVTAKTIEVLLADKPVRYVTVLIYDDRHYMRITDTDPELWKRMLQQCASCGH